MGIHFCIECTQQLNVSCVKHVSVLGVICSSPKLVLYRYIPDVNLINFTFHSFVYSPNCFYIFDFKPNDFTCSTLSDLCPQQSYVKQIQKDVSLSTPSPHAYHHKAYRQTHPALFCSLFDLKYHNSLILQFPYEISKTCLVNHLTLCTVSIYHFSQQQCTTHNNLVERANFLFCLTNRDAFNI